ncbi:MAG: hypothetical protein FWF03_02360 [Defluviitaleaceae bacterium]|nr:hypothetical protein [Defluviitaleaceae bacterium]
MKKFSKKFFLLINIVIWLFIQGCGNEPKGDKVINNELKEEEVIGNKPKEDEKIINNEQSIFIHNDSIDFITFAVTERYEIVAYSASNGLNKYSTEGELIESYPNIGPVTHLNYENGALYAISTVTWDLIEIILEDEGKVKVICGFSFLTEIRGMAVAGDNAYLLGVPAGDEFDYSSWEVGKYIDFGEKIFEVDLKTGKITVVNEIENPIVIYRGEGDGIYVYSHPKDTYIIGFYNQKNKKLGQIAEMNDVGYAMEFAYEFGFFIYQGYETLGHVTAYRMSDGFKINIMDDVLTMPGSAFKRAGGNVAFLGQTAADVETHTIETRLFCIQVTEDHAKLMRNPVQNAPNITENGKDAEPIENVQAKTEEPAPYRGTVTISSGLYGKVFDINYINHISGIETMYINQPSTVAGYQAFLSSIMAGDDRIDIYILNADGETSSALRDLGGFVPLTSSKPISDYLKDCYGWVGEVAKKNGEIWMLPLQYNSSFLWYVPENFNRFGLNPSDFEHFDDYLDTVAKFNVAKRDGFKSYATYVNTYENFWLNQYTSTYSGINDEAAFFDTDLFKNYFKTIWTGWLRYGNPDLPEGHHPLLQYDYMHYRENIPHELGQRSVDYDLGTVVFKLENLHFHYEKSLDDIENWRALPLPRLSEEVTKNYFYVSYALVNPHSKNKELAIAYLEAAASDMLSAITFPAFVIKDEAAYAGHYDMGVPLYRDLHSIFADGEAIIDAFPFDYNVVDAYQSGKKTLDEVIETLNRQYDIWKNE